MEFLIISLSFLVIYFFTKNNNSYKKTNPRKRSNDQPRPLHRNLLHYNSSNNKDGPNPHLSFTSLPNNPIDRLFNIMLWVANPWKRIPIPLLLHPNCRSPTLHKLYFISLFANNGMGFYAIYNLEWKKKKYIRNLFWF